MFMPPPERFSTMIGWPSRFCNSSPSARTKMSLVPPALLAVMTRMGLVGQACALRGRRVLPARAATRRCEQQGERFHRCARPQFSLSNRRALLQKIFSLSAAGMSRSWISLIARGFSDVSGGASLPYSTRSGPIQSSTIFTAGGL